MSPLDQILSLEKLFNLLRLQQANPLNRHYVGTSSYW